MTSRNIPIVNKGLLYINDMQVVWASNTTLTIAAGQCRSDDNLNDIVVSSDLTLNAANTGANGLDTGSLANTTWYYVYAIGDSSNNYDAASLLSTIAPASLTNLPYGYDIKRLIGYALTDGSAHFLAFYITGTGQRRMYLWDAAPAVLSSGTDTSFTEASIAAGVPPVATEVLFTATFTPNTGGDTFAIRSADSSSTNGYPVSAAVAGVSEVKQLWGRCSVSSSAASIDYKVATSGSLNLYVVGFDLYL
jgi:hypothetical protein